MLRTAITRSINTLRLRSTPFITMSLRHESGGSAGSVGSGFSRPQGEAGGDSFTKREKAAEDYYIRQKEKEKLLALREKLQQQRAHLDELDKHIEELTRDQGGERN